MKIYNVTPAGKPKGIERKGVKRKVETIPVKNGDKVQISTKARGMQESQSVVKTGVTALKNYPDVREDRIQEVREKIQQGYFSSKEVKEGLAEKLLQNLGF